MGSPRPQHTAENAAAFASPEVVAAYDHRPKYPQAVIDHSLGLLGDGPRRVLDLGCGLGELSRRLAPQAERVDAVDPSRAMIEAARQAPGGGHASLRWHESTAEAFALDGPYGLAVCAASVHWLDWRVVMPRLDAALAPGPRLLLVTGRALRGAWSETLQEVIVRYSVIQDYVPSDVVEDLEESGHFVVEDRSTINEPYALSIGDYIEYLHAMSSLARHRLGSEGASRFDSEVRALLGQHAEGGIVRGDVEVGMAWGRPR